MESLSELALWVSRQTPGMLNTERGYIIDAIRRQSQRPGWGEDWTEFLQSLPPLQDMVPKFPPVHVVVDPECPAEEFWTNLRERFPEIAARLQREGKTEITEFQWEVIQCLQGFYKGPWYAPTALIKQEKS